MTRSDTSSSLLSSEPGSNLNYRATLLLAASGFFIGGFISFGILVGDELGRVNILYLLLVYLLLPIASVLISTISLIFGGPINLAQCLKSLPLWSPEQQQHWRHLRQQGFDKLWFFQTSQIVAMCFSAAGLMVFFLLLLTTDINFVWRSTLLTAQDLIPLLQWLSIPWSFWQAAQPSVELLQLTQDSRISPQRVALSMYAQWWQFVLAIQIFYSFLPRGLLLISARLLYLRRMARLERSLQVDLNGQNNQQDQQAVLAPVVTEIENNCTLINWGDIPETIVDEVLTRFQPGVSGRLFAGPTAEEAEQLIAQQSEGNQLVLLRSWEPPMAELADYLREGAGYLLPLDWKDSGLDTIESYHLQEWRRFVAIQEKWQLLIWPEPGK